MMSQRLSAQEEIVAELAASFSEEVTRLRATMAHWQSTVKSGQPPNGE